MRARFVGDPRHHGSGPEVLRAFGLLYVKGEWRDVSDATDHAIGKMKINNHFEIDDGTADKPDIADLSKAAPSSAPRKPITIPENWRKEHHARRIAWARDISQAVVDTANEADRLIEEYLSKSRKSDVADGSDDDDFSDLDEY